MRYEKNSYPARLHRPPKAGQCVWQTTLSLPFLTLVFRMSRSSVPEVSLPDAPEPIWVICLCAEWCGLCRDYEAVFAQMAQRFPAFRFVWLDIEDQAELVGDMDVETFPTLLMVDRQGSRFFGPLTPQAHTLSRLLESLENASLQAVPLAPVMAHLLHGLQSAPQHWIKA